MRSRELELEIRMQRKPNVSNKGRLYIHGGGDSPEGDQTPLRPIEDKANEAGAERKEGGDV